MNTMTATLISYIPAADGPVTQPEATAPAGSAGIATILGWLLWGVFILCMVGVLLSAGKLAVAHNRGEPVEAGKGIVFALIAAIIAGSAAFLVNTAIGGA